MHKIIDLTEFNARPRKGKLSLQNWGGWTTIDRDVEENYKNVKNSFQTKRVHEDDFLFFENFEGDEGLFVDIGANMGFSVISFRNVNKTMPILSFEINPMLEGVLRRVQRDIVRFDFRMVGVSDKAGESIMYIPVHGGLLCTPLASLDLANFEPDHRRKGWLKITGSERFELLRVPVKTVTFDELQLSPAIIKIDVEMAEMRTLRGMERTLITAQPIVMCEKNDDLTFVDWMVARGFQRFVYISGGNTLWEYPEGPVPRLNVFFVHQNRIAELTRRNVKIETTKTSDVLAGEAKSTSGSESSSNWNFAHDGDGAPLLQSGWSVPDRYGPWTMGRHAGLAIPLHNSGHKDGKPIKITISGYPFIPPSKGKQGLSLSVNGRELARAEFTTNTRATLECYVSDPALLTGDNTLILTIDHPTAPAQHGSSKDERKLGFHLTNMVVFEP